MEALGYASLWASDHIVIPYSIASRYPYSPTGDFPLSPTTSFLEPLVALGLVAGVTERIRLGTTVLVLPHRHPGLEEAGDRKSTRLNSSHLGIPYAVFCF